MAATTIFFAYDDVGTVTIVIKRLSDGKFWKNATNSWVTDAPTPLQMVYDSDLDQYTTTASPTARVRWTAFDDGDSSIMGGEAGGDIPQVTIPPSASTYTMAEVVSRIRVDVWDPDSDRYTDAQILAVIDKCNSWLHDLAFKTKSAMGSLLAIYTGDGVTKEWGNPSDWRGWKNFVNPDTVLGGDLHFIPKTVYDRGVLALEAGSRIVAYTMLSNKIYFVSDPLPDGQVLNGYYYPRSAKLAILDAVPFDGVFLDFMVQWGTVNFMATDEYTPGIEKDLLVEMMQDVKSFMDEHRDWPQTINVPKSGWINANTKQARSQRGRFRT